MRVRRQTVDEARRWGPRRLRWTSGVACVSIAAAVPAAAAASPLFDGKLFGRSFAVLEADGPAEGVTIVIGCPDYEDPKREGRVLLVSAKDGRLRRELAAPDLEGFGEEVCAAGDVDGNGHEDYAVAAVDWSGAEPSVVHVYSKERDEPIHSWRAERAVPSPGVALAGPGDLDDDGHADLVVCFHGYESGTRWTGAVVARSGRTGDVLFERSAEREGVSYGERLHAVGDLDGDGRSDLAVTASGPVCGEGFVELVSGADGETWLTLRGDERNATFGHSICVVPDLDGDGRDDLVVGSWDHDGAGEGRLTLHSTADGRVLAERRSGLPGFGRAVALRARSAEPGAMTLLVGADDLGIACGGVAEVSVPDGAPRLVLRGDSNDWHLGSSIARVSDLDGDGAPEFVIGNDHTQAGQPGRIRVVSGASSEVLLLLGPARYRRE